MTPQELSHQILETIFTLARDLNQDLRGITIDDIVLERPKNSDFGDWSSNIAMRLANPWKTNPVELASTLSSQIALISGVKSVDVAGPGFINIHLETAVLGSVVRRVLDEGTDYGQSKNYQGISFNLEFVSANPTGPIHIGGTRWAAVGDSLARILSACGADVTREYYFNDHGSQIERFTNSLIAAYRGDDPPEDGYGGEYIHEISSRVSHAYGPGLDQLPSAELKEVFRSIGVQLMFGEIKNSLHTFGVDFDVYFHENSLHESDAIELAINKLREKQHIYENEGAIWLRTSEFGDDKDRVILKSDGEPAYIAADLAYYLNKRERGFERNIIMLGADHHGYVARMMAMCAAFGDEPGVNLEILIGQMVNLIRNGKPVRMSKRAGSIVTLEDLVDAVGVDASRYALVRSSSNSQLDIDLDLLGKRTNDKPVFYVQYAYARTCSVRKNAEVASVKREEGFCPELLTHESESQLLRVLQEFPQVVSSAGELREPHRVARYLEELAGSYHRWYDKCRVIPNNEEKVSDLHRTRLWLNDAAGQVLKNGLNLLGVSSPQKM